MFQFFRQGHGSNALGKGKKENGAALTVVAGIRLLLERNARVVDPQCGV
jgi:hypothetical protein